MEHTCLKLSPSVAWIIGLKTENIPPPLYGIDVPGINCRKCLTSLGLVYTIISQVHMTVNSFHKIF